MVSGPFFVLFYIFLGIILLVFGYGLFTFAAKRSRFDRAEETRRSGGGVCPVCQSTLTGANQIKSVMYPGKKDRLCHIFGCPNCHPYAKPGITRICPVCKKPVAEEAYLVARMFDRAGGKHHVHILGCTNCRLSSKNDTYRP